MSADPRQRPNRMTQSWRYLESKAVGKPESAGGLLALYIAVLAAIIFYYTFR